MQKKICLLGAFGVGKTSLVARFVHSMFSEKYLTTVGVKIDKKSLEVDAAPIELVIWDIYGQDDFQKVRVSYLRGAAGYILVADGTRRATLDTAVELQRLAELSLGRVPFVLAMNKADLTDDWEIGEDAIGTVVQWGWPVFRTSAKTGAHVEEAFSTLARAMLTTTAGRGR
jgi:small GTP-binding protein